MKLKRIFLASLFFMIFFMCSSVDALTYGSLSSRTAQNNKMLNEANSMNSVYRSSFTSLEYKEFRETNYSGLNSVQLGKINTLADQILEGNDYTDEVKMEKFYDFILDNFYYYNTPWKISGLSNLNKFDNPYYLITLEYEQNGKIRARANGYAMTLLMLARSESIPARLVGGYYNKSVRDSYHEWSISGNLVNHVWIEAYVNGSWQMFDPVADSYKTYNENTLEYNDDNSLGLYSKKYFMPVMSDFSKTHIAFQTYTTSKNVKYISNTNDRKQILSFLNQKNGAYTNGARINSLYNPNDSSTWFLNNDKSSTTDGYGNLTKIYWPSNRVLGGNLNLKSLSKLDTLIIQNNGIKSLNISGCSSLNTVNVYNNKMTKIVVVGARNLTYFKAQKNPATYIKYEYSSKRKTATIKANTGGTVSVKHAIVKKKSKHYLSAKANSGYVFSGWYKGKKRVSTRKDYTVVSKKSFTYVAKFTKVPTNKYIKISIKSQKLWFYKNNKIVYSSKIVTGQKGLNDTPKGTFRIRGKAKNVYLVGANYRNFVSFWMPIVGSIGMHDASWRWNFGGNIYKYNGSHGCINLPYSTAKYIYKNAPVGTKVKVVS